MSFLSARFDRLGRNIFVKLDDFDADLFLFPYGGARVFRCHNQMAALAAQRPSRRSTDEAPAGRPNARPANLADVRTVTLGQRPRIIVLCDIRTSGDAEVKINLADKVEQVTVAVDETGENGFAFDVDHTSVARNRDFPSFADGFDALAFDDDHRIFEGCSAGGVDEC